MKNTKMMVFQMNMYVLYLMMVRQALNVSRSLMLLNDDGKCMEVYWHGTSVTLREAELRDIFHWNCLCKIYLLVFYGILYLIYCATFKTLAYLESKASSKACQTCKMMMHIQIARVVRKIYSSIFKDI